MYVPCQTPTWSHVNSASNGFISSACVDIDTNTIPDNYVDYAPKTTSFIAAVFYIIFNIPFLTDIHV